MPVEERTLATKKLFASLRFVPGVGLAILDEQLRFRSVNSALAEINGLPVARHLGQTISAVLGGFAHQVSPLANHVLATGRPLLNCNLAGILPTRSEVGYWIGHYLPVSDSAIAAVVLEVTNQHKVEHLLASMQVDQEAELDRSLEAVERDYIIHILKKARGRVSGKTGAAIRLGMKRTTLQSRLYKLGINARDYK
jgi:DNA-binding protein Fis